MYTLFSNSFPCKCNVIVRIIFSLLLILLLLLLLMFLKTVPRRCSHVVSEWNGQKGSDVVIAGVWQVMGRD